MRLSTGLAYRLAAYGVALTAYGQGAEAEGDRQGFGGLGVRLPRMSAPSVPSMPFGVLLEVDLWDGDQLHVERHREVLVLGGPSALLSWAR